MQTDDHKCALGKWLYGPDAKAFADSDPEAKKLIKAIEAPHNRLHSTAIQIDNVWHQRCEGLEQQLFNARDAHTQWAQIVANTILVKQQELKVQKDSTKCDFGQFLQGQFFKEVTQNNPQLAKIFQPVITAHHKLHESANSIDAALTASKFDEEIVSNLVDRNKSGGLLFFSIDELYSSNHFRDHR